MPLTNATEELALKWLFTTEVVARPTAWTLAALLTLPNNAGVGAVEVSTIGTGYAREPVSFTVTAGDPSRATNLAAVEWDAATAAWGDIVGVAVYDDTGTMRGFGALPATRTIGIDDILRIPAGELDIEIIALP